MCRSEDEPYAGPLLSVESLSLELPTADGNIKLVDDVSFTLEQRSTLGIVGESGAGKSMTGFAIIDLLDEQIKRSAQSIRLNGDELFGLSAPAMTSVRGKRIGMVFQEPMTALNPVLSIGDQVAEGIRRHFPQVSRRQAWSRAEDMLDAVRIPNPKRTARSYPHELSGGMRQRVVIACALASEPELLIADEPTTALDVTVQSQILKLLKELQTELGMGLIIITHDLGVVADISDSVMVMYSGQVVETGTAKQILSSPRHPYSYGLKQATPRIDKPHFIPIPIPGFAPRAGAAITGCRFANRCEFALDRCSKHPIELTEFNDGATARCVRAPELSLGEE